jgi:hypothetical protein
MYGIYFFYINVFFGQYAFKVHFNQLLCCFEKIRQGTTDEIMVSSDIRAAQGVRLCKKTKANLDSDSIFITENAE